MRKLLFALLLAQLVGCAAVDPHDVMGRRADGEALAPGQALGAERRAQTFDFVWQRIRDQYVDPQLRGVDWAATGARMRPLALGAATDEQFWDVLDRMTAELGDAHTQVLSPRRYAWWKDKQSMTLGLRAAEVGGQLVVTDVAPGSAAERQGLKPGDEIRRIAGQPALDWWQAALNEARKNSSERAQRKTVLRLLNAGGPDDAAAQVALDVDSGGRVTSVVLDRAMAPDRPELAGRVLPSGYGYLRLSAFDAKLAKKSPLSVAVFDLGTAPGLLIDLRRNSGGSLGVATDLMNTLFARKVSLGQVITRTGKPLTGLFGLRNLTPSELTTQGNATPYNGPVVVLVDDASASASELVAASLQGMGRAKVVGRQSCGCLLGVLGFVGLPGGGALSYSQLDFEPPGGRRVEGRGVQPDVEVTLTRAALQAGRDLDLEAGIALLDRLTGRADAPVR